MVKALRFGSEPRPGERILVLHREWLELVFRGRKMEIRGRRLARVQLDDCRQSVHWARARDFHGA